MNVVDLGAPEAQSRELCGGKGAALARQLARGMPVPKGFVVTTRAFDGYLHSLGLLDEATDFGNAGERDAQTLHGRVRAGTLPEALRAEVQNELQRCEGHPGDRWAVRSSAVAEDTERASFAGQYDTILGLAAEEVPRAIAQVWASTFGHRALQYRTQQGATGIAMAVVVQRLVAADTAGVCFTRDPLRGGQDIVINANYGLGESIVSGYTTPDTYVVERTHYTIVTQTLGAKKAQTVPAEGGVRKTDVPIAKQRGFCLSAERASEIARLALAVEHVHEDPVDIEWAFEGETLYLLQARAITTTTAAARGPLADWHPANDTVIDPRFPLYSNGNISEVLPGCITPLSWDHTGQLIEHSFRTQLAALGAIARNHEGPNVLGFFFHRPYINVSLLLDAAARTPGMTPDTILEEFVGKPEQTTPSLTLSDFWPHRWPRLFSALFAVLKSTVSLDARIEACRRAAELDADEFSEARVASASDELLLERVRMGEELAAPSVVHIWASSLATVIFAQLRGRTAKWLEDDDGAIASELVTGIDGLPSVEPTLALHSLSQRIADDEELAAWFRGETTDQEALAALQESPLHIALDRFIDAHGHRGVGEAELSRPCWREDPAQVIALMRNNLRPGAATPINVRERQQHAYREAMKRLDALAWWQRAWLGFLIRKARLGFLARETMKDLVVRRLDRSRIIYRELNRRLIARALLDAQDDLYFLTWHEVRDLFTGARTTEDAATIIATRRRDYRWSQRVEVPKLQEGTARTLSADDTLDGGALEGMGVSPGNVTGIARIVTDPRDGAYLEPGEILVAPVTDVAWTSLFAQAAGLVVEVGGLLSHGSIVAREYGVPAVVGVAGATTAIRTGDRIALDGATGKVVKLDDER